MKLNTNTNTMIKNLKLAELDAKISTAFLNQGFGRERDGNRGKFIGSNLVIVCYKKFEKFALCKSISQSEVIFTVYSEPIKGGHVKINFS